MDSKLVVEQMSGRWKIKHPDMRPLAARGRAAGAAGTTYTWVPREQNKHADRLANEALDGMRRRHVAGDAPRRGRSRRRAAEAGRPTAAARLVPARRTADHAGPGAARRHRAHRRQALLRRARRQQPRAQRRGPRPGPGHRRLAGAAGRARSTRWSPRPCAAPASPPRSSPSGSGRRWSSEPGFAEMEFGTWDGLTFAEVARAAPRRPRRLARLARRRARRRRVVPRWCEKRVLAGLDRLLDGARRQDRRSWSATSRRSRCWSRTPWTRRWSRCSGWSWRPASVTVLSFFARRQRALAADVQRPRPTGDGRRSQAR